MCTVLLDKCAKSGYCYVSVQKQGIAEQACRSWVLLGKCAKVGHGWESVQKQGFAGQVYRSGVFAGQVYRSGVFAGQVRRNGLFMACVQKQGIAERQFSSRVLLCKYAEAGYCWASVQKQYIFGHVRR